MVSRRQKVQQLEVESEIKALQARVSAAREENSLAQTAYHAKEEALRAVEVYFCAQASCSSDMRTGFVGKAFTH